MFSIKSSYPGKEGTSIAFIYVDVFSSVTRVEKQVFTSANLISNGLLARKETTSD
jgi:hypothetical protein